MGLAYFFAPIFGFFSQRSGNVVLHLYKYRILPYSFV